MYCVAIIDGIAGDVFEVRYDSLDALWQNSTVELPSNKNCYELFESGKDELNSIICTQMIGMASGIFDIPGMELSRLTGYIPEVTLEAFLARCFEKSLLLKDPDS